MQYEIKQDLCDKCKVTIKDVNCDVLDKVDCVQVYGHIQSTAENRTQQESIHIVVDFLDYDSSIVYSAMPSFQGSFIKTGYTTFHLEVDSASVLMELNRLAKIVIYPVFY